MAEPRLGRQTPTQSVILPYYETKGSEAINYITNQEESLRSGRSCS